MVAATTATAAARALLHGHLHPARRVAALARSQQKIIYNLLFRTASQALLQLAQDPRFVGGTLGLVGVAPNWTRDLRYHPQSISSSLVAA